MVPDVWRHQIYCYSLYTQSILIDSISHMCNFCCSINKLNLNFRLKKNIKDVFLAVIYTQVCGKAAQPVMDCGHFSYKHAHLTIITPWPDSGWEWMVEKTNGFALLRNSLSLIFKLLGSVLGLGQTMSTALWCQRMRSINVNPASTVTKF